MEAVQTRTEFERGSSGTFEGVIPAFFYRG
jgi:hypothetical protein